MLTVFLFSFSTVKAQQDSTQQIKDRLAKLDSKDNRFNQKVDSVQGKVNSFLNPNLNSLKSKIKSKKKANNDSIQFYKQVAREKKRVQSRYDKAKQNNQATEKYVSQLDSLSQLKYDPSVTNTNLKRAKARVLTTKAKQQSDQLQNKDLALSSSSVTSGLDTLKNKGPLKEIGNAQSKVSETEQKINAPVNKVENVANEKLALMNKEGGAGANLPSNVNAPDAGINTNLNVTGNTSLPQGHLDINNPLQEKDNGLSEITNKVTDVKNAPTEQLNKVKSIDEIKGAQSQLGRANDITDKAQGYTSDVKNVASGNLSEVKEAPKALEQQVTKLDEVSGIQKEAGAFGQYKNLAGKGNDPEAMKKLALEQAQKSFKPPVNHFAGQEQALRTAMDNMSKLKTKYESLDSLKDIPKRKPNAMKGKPFIERIVPGITLQVQKNSDVLIDYNPYLGYRISGKLTVGLGWNERFNVGKHFHFSLKDRIYGPRAYVDFKFWKGFSVRTDLEKMNTYVPSIASGINDYNHRAWVWSAFVGLKKEYKFWGSVKGNAQLLYNLYDDHNNSPYADRLIVRMGFEFPLKKKETKKKE